MTISTDACLAIHVVYNDGALFVPRHVRFWHYHQQRPSLANSLNVVVANQRLVLAMTNSGYTEHKKLSYRRGTARCVVSIEILPIATQQCRNYLYDKSWPDRWYEVGDFVGGNAWSTMCTQPWRHRVGCHCLKCHKQTDDVELCSLYHLSTDDLLWWNFLSPQCRNCSRDPDHAHIGSTHSSQD